jgi:hypothetical protein
MGLFFYTGLFDVQLGSWDTWFGFLKGLKFDVRVSCAQISFIFLFYLCAEIKSL